MNDQWTPELELEAAGLLDLKVTESAPYFFRGEGGVTRTVPFCLAQWSCRGIYEVPVEIAVAHVPLQEVLDAASRWCGEDRARWRAFTQTVLELNPKRPALNGVYQAARAIVTAKPGMLLLALARAAKGGEE